MIADYFRNPILVSVLRVISLSVVINRSCSIQAILVWRQMEFRKDMLIQLATGVLSGLTGIVMAYFGYGYVGAGGYGACQLDRAPHRLLVLLSLAA